ncbi:hypothetical protein FB45DRAFT_787061 [Roridomyces roridus]|uniref:Ubiquitin-like domain-containing protein n=1 Tax=Roridomyces roridus TaxID=1738132 RepID=A0AAD7C4E2_9AGAR|nr:hypothetical protein FB45DRAFT_787061 [Roridomyces roridus]
MPPVDIRVELPAFSQTINVQLADSSTILDLKREIFRICVGGPRVEGQRIIWRGRPLLDTEKVQELWQSPNEPRIVHLAVHPSAWSSTPPEIPQAPLSSPPHIPSPAHLPSQPSASRSPVFASATPLAYVSARHQQALNALEQSRVSHLDPTILVTRTAAVQFVERHGWTWPSILDEEFPPAIPGGVKYQRTILEEQTYLRLVESTEQPTAVQVHALNVLSHTFPIMSLPASVPGPLRVTASQPLPNVNAILQQLGLPGVRNAANANLAPNVNVVAVQPPEIPLRPLLLPLFLLLLRTAILLYFFAPARKPVFGILIVMWMLYEVWRPIRDGLLRGWNRAAPENANRNQQQQQPQQEAARQAPNGQANGVVADRRQGPAAPRAGLGPGAVAANDIDQQMAAAFDGLANLNIEAEAQAVRRGAPVEEPGLWHKTVTFVTLLLTTVHPAVWNRRRVVLRQREGQIRMDANARAAQLDENVDDPQSQERIRRRDQLVAQHQERPEWLRNYMERVVEAAWVDEAD